MTRRVAIAEARDRLSTHVRSAEHGTPVVITRRGRPVDAIVAAEEYARLERLRAAGLQAGLAGVAGGWEGSEDLVAEVDAQRRSPPRPLELVTGSHRHFQRISGLHIRPLRGGA